MCFEYNQKYKENEETDRVHYTKAGSVEECQNKCNLQRRRKPKKTCEVCSWSEATEECDMFGDPNAMKVVVEEAEGFVTGPYDCKYDRGSNEEEDSEEE